MANTNFVNYQTIIDASWLNDVNNLVYQGIIPATTIYPTNITASGTIQGLAIQNTPIGSVTPSTGVFTSLTATTSSLGTITAISINNTPIGNTNPSTGAFTSLSSTLDATIHGLTVGLGGGSQGNNTVLGYGALTNNTTGNNNVSVGTLALGQNTTASNNTAVGYQAGYSTTGNGTGITAFGYQAAYSHTASSPAFADTYIGYHAGYSSTTGSDNTFIGGFAGANMTTGTSSTAVGSGALYTATTGAGNNDAFGYASLQNLTTGNYNSSIGGGSGIGVTTGNGNVMLGLQAGYGSVSLTTGSYNVLIGVSASPAASTDSGEIVIGTTNSLTGATGKGSNTGFIDPNGGGVYQGNNSASWSVTSDQRIKKNIVNNNTGLSLINQIQVRNFEYRKPEEITELPQTLAVNKNGVQLGVIAQELQKVVPDCVKQEESGFLSVDPSNLTWYLINAVKELSTELTQLKAEIAELKGAK